MVVMVIVEVAAAAAADQEYINGTDRTEKNGSEQGYCAVWMLLVSYIVMFINTQDIRSPFVHDIFCTHVQKSRFCDSEHH